jgi:hypothetical protein
LFGAKVVILWQGTLQYNARKLRKNFRSIIGIKKLKPDKCLWYCPEYGKSLVISLVGTRSGAYRLLVYCSMIPKFIEFGNLVVTCRFK